MAASSSTIVSRTVIEGIGQGAHMACRWSCMHDTASGKDIVLVTSEKPLLIHPYTRNMEAHMSLSSSSSLSSPSPELDGLNSEALRCWVAAAKPDCPELINVILLCRYATSPMLFLEYQKPHILLTFKDMKVVFKEIDAMLEAKISLCMYQQCECDDVNLPMGMHDVYHEFRVPTHASAIQYDMVQKPPQMESRIIWGTISSKGKYTFADTQGKLEEASKSNGTFPDQLPCTKEGFVDIGAMTFHKSNAFCLARTRVEEIQKVPKQVYVRLKISRPAHSMTEVSALYGVIAFNGDLHIETTIVHISGMAITRMDLNESEFKNKYCVTDNHHCVIINMARLSHVTMSNAAVVDKLTCATVRDVKINTQYIEIHVQKEWTWSRVNVPVCIN